MQIHKILQYSPYELVKIATYRFIYKCLLSVRKHSKKKSYAHIREYNRHLPQGLIKLYSQYVITDKSVIIDANKILDGNIFIFEKWGNFNYEKDWLKDPNTNLYWDRDIYASDAPFVQNGFSDVKYILEPNKLNPLVKVAQAYYISKDDKYIAFIFDALKGWMKCVPPECSVVNRIVMDIAYRAINLIHISILCWECDLFHKDVLPIIIGILLHHEDYMWSRLGIRWFKSNNDNNHTVGEIIGLYVSQLFLSSVICKDYSKKLEMEAKSLLPVLEKIIAPSGAYIEQSGNYTKVVAEFLMLYEIFIKSYKIDTKAIRSYKSKNYLGRLINYMHCISYNGIVDNFGDNDGALVLIPFEQNAYNFKHLVNFSNFKNNNFDFLDASQCVYNSLNQDNIHIFTRVGRFAYYVEGAYIHAHNDILSMLLCIKGSRLFIDKGCYYYNSGLKIRKEYVCIKSHNNVSIDNIDQSDLMSTGNRSYPTSQIKSLFASKDIFDFVGYLKYKQITQHRHISYLGNQLLIHDEIEVADDATHEATISYLLGSDIAIKKADNLLYLCDSVNDNKFIFSIDECKDIEFYDDFYYPTYGVKKKTHRLFTKKKFTQKICLTTRIEIV